MAQHRTASRRPVHHLRRQRRAPQRILFRRHRRRTVEDHRRRHDLEAGHRRPDSKLVGRRGRGRGIESRRGLHRHGRDGAARQHHAGRRRLQIHRRGQDLEAHRARRHAGDRAHSRRSVERRISFTSRRSAIPTGRTRSAACSARSDGGKTWQKILYKDDHAGAVDLCIDPHNPRVLYAAIWDVYRTSWTLSSGGPRSGFYKSTDGGDHWTEITRNPGLPQGHHRQNRRGRFGAIRIASTRWSKPRTAACSAPRTRARPGRASMKTAACGSARSITRASLPIRRTKTRSTS